jgi:hypothetical protein
LHVRAAPGRRFNDMNDRVIAAARLPAHAPHCAELCWHSPRLSCFFPRHPHRDVAMREWERQQQACGVGSRWCAAFHAPQFARPGAPRPSRSTAGLFPGFHRDRKPPMIYLNSGFDSCREGSPTGRGASHFQT